MLVGNNIALVIYGIAFAGLLEPVLKNYLQSDSLILLLQTIISTFIILLFSEFLPKTLFRLFPNTLLNIFSLPLAFFYVVFYPLTRFSISIANTLLKRVLKTDLNAVAKNPVFSRIDLDEFVRESDSSRIEQLEKNVETEIKLFKNALDFSKVKLREIMVPRTEIEMLEMGTSINDLRQKFVETGYSRILFYRENTDNIIGYVLLMSHQSIFD